MDETYDDFKLFLVKLLNDGYLSNEEIKYITEAIDREAFYDDSEELINEINEVKLLIDANSLEISTKALKEKCNDKYDQYILQRAAFEFDYISEIDE